MNYLKYFFASVFLFLVLFFDQTFIGPIKVSHLWKIILFGYITVLVLSYSRKGLFNSFFLLGVITGISLLINTTASQGFQNDLLIFFDIYSLPLFYVYFRNLGEIENSSQSLEKLLLFFVFFTILSNLPFLLGILESPKDIEEILSSEEDSFSGVTGLFHNASGASKVFTVATLTIIAFRKRFIEKSQWYRIIWLALVIIGIASIVFSFTRTGWALFILGFSFLLLYRSKLRSKLRSVLVIGIMIFLAVILFKSNELLYNRLIGKKEGRVYTKDFNSISSGRGTLYSYSIDIIKEARNTEFLIGFGSKGTFDKMQEKIGNRTYPHNRFLEIFLVGGLVTFLLYLFYLKKIFGLLPKLNHPYVTTLEKLPKAIFFIYFISLFPSHGLGIYSNIIFAAIIVQSQRNYSNDEMDRSYDNIPKER